MPKPVGRPKERQRVPMTVRVLKSCKRAIEKRVTKGNRSLDTRGKILELWAQQAEDHAKAEEVYKPSVD